jgi:hypothetical protein
MWPKRNCWFCLLTSLIRMSIVDMHSLLCNLQNERYTDRDILEFSVLIFNKLVVRSRRQNERLATLTGANSECASNLERIADMDRKCRIVRTDKKAKRWRIVGKYMHLNCFIYCKYLTPRGETEYVQTAFR